MAELLILNESDVRRMLNLGELRESLADAFCAFSRGETSVPARVAALTGAGLLAAMPGYLPNAGLAVKLVSVFPDNHGQGIRGHQALILLFDPLNGTPLALMDGTYITAVRTAGASAVAAEELARPESKSLAILGAGVQGRAHLEALSLIFDLAEVRVASRNRRHAQDLVETVRSKPGAGTRIVAVDSFEDAVRRSDIVCCCTDSADPVIDGDWVAPGTHIGSVGFGVEFGFDLAQTASIFVEWRGAAAMPSPAGASELQDLDPATVTEIGEVLLGTRPGRTSREQVTLYKSTGHAMEDVAAAALVFEQARTAGVGTTVHI